MPAFRSAAAGPRAARPRPAGREDTACRSAYARRATAALLGVAALVALPAAAAHGMGLPRPVPPPRITSGAGLTVTYDDGSGRPRTYSLACAPGRTAERDADSCRHLQEIGGPVPAVPEGQACSMIYGGPQTAQVHGTWQGRPVSESYRRTNGCEVDRWSRMVPALPNPASAVTRPDAQAGEQTGEQSGAQTAGQDFQHAHPQNARPARPDRPDRAQAAEPAQPAQSQLTG
jgi:hypothetical protein